MFDASVLEEHYAMVETVGSKHFLDKPDNYLYMLTAQRGAKHYFKVGKTERPIYLRMNDHANQGWAAIQLIHCVSMDTSKKPLGKYENELLYILKKMNCRKENTREWFPYTCEYELSIINKMVTCFLYEIPFKFYNSSYYLTERFTLAELEHIETKIIKLLDTTSSN